MVDSGDRSGNSGRRALNPRADFKREMLAAIYVYLRGEGEENNCVPRCRTFLRVALKRSKHR